MDSEHTLPHLGDLGLETAVTQADTWTGLRGSISKKSREVQALIGLNVIYLTQPMLRLSYFISVHSSKNHFLSVSLFNYVYVHMSMCGYVTPPPQ